MSWLFNTLVSPLLLFISIPLAAFAALTTTLAFSTLFFRVFLVYTELAAALVQDHFADQTTPAYPPNSNLLKLAISPDDKQLRRKSRRSSGSSNGGSLTPKAPESSGFGIYSGGGAARDFEGVGGWRFPGPDDDDDDAWENMNSRLELPVLVNDSRTRHHHRSRTSGSLASASSLANPSAHSSARTPPNMIPLVASPDDYFTKRGSSKSTTALDAANIGKPLLRRKPSSSSSGSSLGSNKTLHLTLSNS
ncbi:hypothetical protein MMC21_006149 [Puttea exsequens]|nr:hypothetical protein [Puttea exsequens]